MKILVITNLYPNSQEPTRGMYNKQQIGELSRLCELKVMAPLPWAPKWLTYSQVPQKEIIDGIEASHPRYFMIPKIGRCLYGFYFMLSLIVPIARIRKGFDFDVIYAPWVYPDGFGAFLTGKFINKPVLIGALGSDINITTKSYLRRKLIAFALRNCEKVISVSNALKNRMIEIGVPEKQIRVLPNGVDRRLFKVMDRLACRGVLELPEKAGIILFAGNLVPIKGLDFLIEAFSKISAADKSLLLVIVGDGILKTHLIQKAQALGLSDKIIFAGRQPYEKIPLWMNACDVFCLPSLNEGMPNVILECLACGKPVVATKVGGIPEIVTSEKLGLLLPPSDANGLAEALNKKIRESENSGLADDTPEVMSWEENAKILYEELLKVIKGNKERI